MTVKPAVSGANQQSGKRNVINFLTKNSMTIALVLVFVLFYFLTNKRLLLPQNMSNLLLQNGYVLVLACGMLLCILTGGNIDLSVGSVICLTGGLAAVLIYHDRPLPSGRPGCRCVAGLLDRLCADSSVHHHPGGHVYLPRYRPPCPGQ